MTRVQIIQKLRAEFNRLGRDEFMIQTFASLILTLRRLKQDVKDTKRKSNKRAP